MRRITYGTSRCHRNYPKVGSRKRLADLKTTAQGYDKEQLKAHIVNLKKALSLMPRDGIVDVTVFRGNNQVTVTRDLRG